MAKMRRADSKSVLAQQRASVRRGARGKMHVGDDTGAERAREAQRERVHQMQERFEEKRAAEEREQFLTGLRREREEAERQAAEVQREEHLHEPLAALFGELLSDGFRLARTFILLPFRVAGALRRQAQRAAEA